MLARANLQAVKPYGNFDGLIPPNKIWLHMA